MWADSKGLFSPGLQEERATKIEEKPRRGNTQQEKGKGWTLSSGGGADESQTARGTKVMERQCGQASVQPAAFRSPAAFRLIRFTSATRSLQPCKHTTLLRAALTVCVLQLRVCLDSHPIGSQAWQTDRMRKRIFKWFNEVLVHVVVMLYRDACVCRLF